MFKFIKMIIKLILIAIVCIVIYFVVQLNPFQHHSDVQVTNQAAATYTLEDNALFRNIPLSQVKTAFNFMDKSEFMAVSGLSLMGYNDKYLAGKRGEQYILYKFGESQVLVFNDESSLQQALLDKNQHIELKDISSY
ncbi:DUF4930 family protein [Macrococcus armenti]|uniref:DUF4930 family protein n=1 Tax=Macrococcus armenti TaxID=2875764 RepID=UPI001CCAF513|nr:DUF4930 family protein [Macrococcus armenti]UBH14586.1 DUF4930 family protein [Macrococcus armenti]UBH16947.1 DUF4930 family protein [Macrococcus armenti]UBH19210.1 DUF4930 family protein [Macrococcus armenti]